MMMAIISRYYAVDKAVFGSENLVFFVDIFERVLDYVVVLKFGEFGSA